jgi:hypothetical protein
MLEAQLQIHFFYIFAFRTHSRISSAISISTFVDGISIDPPSFYIRLSGTKNIAVFNSDFVCLFVCLLSAGHTAYRHIQFTFNSGCTAKFGCVSISRLQNDGQIHKKIRVNKLFVNMKKGQIFKNESNKSK